MDANKVVKISNKITMSITLIFFVVFGLIRCIDRGDVKKNNLESIPELIRTGYDLMDSQSFLDICKSLNDSILNKINSLGEVELIVIPVIDMEYDSIYWALSNTNTKEYLGVPNRMFFKINLSENSNLRVNNKSISVSDIIPLATDYIFYPDSTEREITLRKKRLDILGIVEISKVAILLEVQIDKNNGFSIMDWKLFFMCLHEAIELCEVEKNRKAFNFWGKGYDSLSFEEKKTATDIVGYNILIRFY